MMPRPPPCGNGRAAAVLLGGGHTRRLGLTLRPQLQQGAPIIPRRHLNEAGKCVVPVFEKQASTGAASEQVMPFDQYAQARCIEAQRVAHAVVSDARSALPGALLMRTGGGVFVRLDRGDG